MARKRTTASKKRVLQLSNDRNSEFLFPELRKSSRSGISNDEPSNKKPSFGKELQNEVRPSTSAFLTPAVEDPEQAKPGKSRQKPEKTIKSVEPDDEPQAGTSRPRQSGAEQATLSCSANSCFARQKSSFSNPLASEAPKRPTTTGKNRPGPEETNNSVEPQPGSSKTRANSVKQTVLPVLPCSTKIPRFVGPRCTSKLAGTADGSKRSTTGKTRPEQTNDSVQLDDETKTQNPRFVGPGSASKLALAVEAPKLSSTITTRPKPEETDNSVTPEDEAQTTQDFEDTSGESDTKNDLYGCNDDEEDELEEIMHEWTPGQEINPECPCGLAKEMTKLKAENDKLRNQNNFLKKRKYHLEQSHARLQQALMSKLLPSTDKPFGKIDGFPGCPSADMILKMSMVAKDSDYIFVKLLTYDIWPEGLAGRKVTARTSNNPKGRGKKNQQSIDDDEAGANNNLDAVLGDDSTDNTTPVRIPLEANKVKFVNDCLRARRILLHDDCVMAKKVASKCNRLMQTVIGNYNRYRSP